MTFNISVCNQLKQKSKCELYLPPLSLTHLFAYSNMLPNSFKLFCSELNTDRIGLHHYIPAEQQLLLLSINYSQKPTSVIYGCSGTDVFILYSQHAPCAAASSVLVEFKK